MEVNGVDLTGKSQDQVVNMLRSIPLNTEVVVVVARPETAPATALPRMLDGAVQSLVSADSREAWEKNKEILTLDIPLNDSGSAGLGVRVTGKLKRTEDGLETDGGIFIMNVIAGGAASKVRSFFTPLSLETWNQTVMTWENEEYIAQSYPMHTA